MDEAFPESPQRCTGQAATGTVLVCGEQNKTQGRTPKRNITTPRYTWAIWMHGSCDQRTSDLLPTEKLQQRKIGSVMYKVYLWCVQVHRRDDQQREPPTYVCRTQVGKTGSDGHPSATQQGMCRAGGLCQKKRKGKERNPIPIPSSNSNSIPRDIDIYPKKKKKKEKRGEPTKLLCCVRHSFASLARSSESLPRFFQRPSVQTHVRVHVTCHAAVEASASPPSSSYYSPNVFYRSAPPRCSRPTSRLGHAASHRPFSWLASRLSRFRVSRPAMVAPWWWWCRSVSGSDGPMCRNVLRRANVRTRGINTHRPCSRSSQTSTQRVGPLRLAAPDERIETGVGQAAHDVGCSQGCGVCF